MSISPTVRHLLQGASRVLEICPDSRDRLSTIRPYPNDQAALRRDAARIGQDFWNVMRREPEPHHP